MIVPPPEVTAAWPKPNYDHPQTRGPASFIVCCCFVTIVLVVVSLRFYTRKRITRNFGADDILLGVGVIFTLALNGVVSYSYFAHIWGLHAWDIRPSNVDLTMQLTIVAQVLYIACSTCVKLSFLVFYQRVLDHYIWRYYRLVLIAITSLVIIVALIYIPVTIFRCSPVRAYWDINPTYEHYCLPKNFPNVSFVIISTVLDFIIVLLPIPMVWGLRVPLRQRIGLCCLFGVGLLICVAGSLRSYYLFYVMYRTWDPGWYRIKVYIATIVETCVGIVCASVPALRPFFVKYWPRFRLTTQRLLPSYVKDISSDASTERSRQHSHAFSLEPPPSRKRPSQTEFDLELLEEDFVPERSGRSMESNLAEGLSANQGASPAKEVKFITRAI